MSRLIDMLYDGDLYPMEHIERDDAYWELNRRLSEKKREWADGLTAEEREKWQELENLQTELVNMELKSLFGCGFRLGCGIMNEVYEEWPADADCADGSMDEPTGDPADGGDIDCKEDHVQ